MLENCGDDNFPITGPAKISVYLETWPEKVNHAASRS